MCKSVRWFSRDRPVMCLVAVRARSVYNTIEADLGAISPGWAAAGGGHGRLAESERAFRTCMSDTLMQRAYNRSAAYI